MIIGIDPGTYHSACVQYDERSGRVIAADPQVENGMVFDWLAGPGHVACEWIESQGMAVGKETFATVWWIGRFFEASGHRMQLVPRREVKLHLCGSMRAKDPNIRQALIDKLGPPGRKASPGPTYGLASHAWQALAVAVTYAERGAAAVVKI